MVGLSAHLHVVEMGIFHMPGRISVYIWFMTFSHWTLRKHISSFSPLAEASVSANCCGQAGLLWGQTLWKQALGRPAPELHTGSAVTQHNVKAADMSMPNLGLISSCGSPIKSRHPRLLRICNVLYNFITLKRVVTCFCHTAVSYTWVHSITLCAQRCNHTVHIYFYYEFC